MKKTNKQRKQLKKQPKKQTNKTKFFKKIRTVVYKTSLSRQFYRVIFYRDGSFATS